MPAGGCLFRPQLGRPAVPSLQPLLTQMKPPNRELKCPGPRSFARWTCTQCRSERFCLILMATTLGEPIKGHWVAMREKGRAIRTQECAAVIPRESVCTEDCGAQRHLESLPPLRTPSASPLEELPSSQLHLQEPHYL